MAGNDATGRFGSGAGRAAVAERGGTSRILAAQAGRDPRFGTGRIEASGRPGPGAGRSGTGGTSRTSRPVPPGGPGLRRFLPLATWLLPAVVVGLVVIAWYSDRLAYFFAAKPHAADIAGSWVLDEAAFARMADAAATMVPAGPARERYRASLDAKAAPYRGATWTFDGDGYAVRGSDGEHRYHATYEGYPPNALAVRPDQGKQIAVLVGADCRTLIISLPVLGIPFSRSP